jgi:hypothetical protein
MIVAEISMPDNVRSIIGHKFNRLTAKRFAGIRVFPSGQKVALIECDCECGNPITVQRSNLVNGHTQSCGCYQDQRRIESHTTHGQARKGAETPLYVVWKSMMQRCSDPNCESWEHYGARGIKVMWKSFEEFARDMESTYKLGLTIERKDFNGNYEKNNCTWIPRRDQNRNYRRNRFIEFNGERLPMVVWAERYGLRQATLRMRLECGWSIEKALTTPLQRIKDRIEFNGESMLLSDWARRIGVDVRILWARLNRGWSVEKTLSTPKLQ